MARRPGVGDYTKQYGQFIAAEVRGGMPLYKIGFVGDEMTDVNMIFSPDFTAVVKMPNYNTVCLWQQMHSEFAAMIEQARKDYADKMADEVVTIADEDVPIHPAGGRDSAFVNWQRNRMEARKWAAGVRDRGRFGTHTTVAGDDKNPLKTITEIVVTRLSNKQDIGQDDNSTA